MTHTAPWTLGFVLILAVSMVACTTEAPILPERTAHEVPPVTTHEAPATDHEAPTLADLVEAQTRFGLALYRRLAENADGESVFISPVSVHTALSMAYNGARGDTQSAMAEAMFLGDLSRDQLNYLVAEMLSAIDPQSLPGVEINIANGLWHRQGVTFHPDFLDRIEAHHQARIDALDFDDPSTPGVINDWVSDQTNGLIPDLIEQIDPDLVMLLVNAVYFKGAWSDPFDPNLTQSHPFTLASGESKQVPMMYKDGRIDHYQGEMFQAIRLPYSDEGRLAMYVFLPKEDSSLAAFGDALSYENWQQWRSEFRPKLGQVWLPRMDIGYKSKLNQVLRTMGMAIAFDAYSADFGDMRPIGEGGDLSISEVTHQTVLKVNEEGTEAAGATSIGVRVTSLPTYQFHFRADRPFFVAICDEETGTMLFVGSVMDPGSGDGS